MENDLVGSQNIGAGKLDSIEKQQAAQKRKEQGLNPAKKYTQDEIDELVKQSPYYKSETFMTLLQRVTRHPDRFVLKQHNNRLAMTVRNIKDVEQAWKTLKEL